MYFFYIFQIELDLLRTLPGNKYFEDILSDKIQALRRVLQAFNLHDPVVGYCQVCDLYGV